MHDTKIHHPMKTIDLEWICLRLVCVNTLSHKIPKASVTKLTYMPKLTLTNKNISVWINYTFQLICLVFSTWIMSRPTTACVTIKVIVVRAANVEGWSTIILVGFWHHTSTLLGNLSNQFTSDWARLLLHQAASAFLACDPVVDVALDQEFSANGAPQSKVHGLVMCLTQRYCCRHSSFSCTGCPAWTRRDSVCSTRETWVSCKGVAPN